MEKNPNFSINPSLKGLNIGYQIDERFEIISKPVRRSHSFVFKVLDLNDNSAKVLLLIPNQIRHNQQALQFVNDQFQIIRILEHPTIARYYEIHSEGRFAYIEMEFVSGHSLKTIKMKHHDNRLAEDEVKSIAEQILDALEYAHNQNILHRDLKPSNIVLTPERRIKLIDFGISEPIRQALNLVQDASASTIILYWSPEQVSNKPLTIQSDIYTLGAVLYDLISGKPPFFTGDVYQCILHKAPLPIPDISPFMNDFLLKALAKEPEKRFRTCPEMRSALQTTGLSVLHSRLSKPAKKEKPKKKKKVSLLHSFLKPNTRYSLISALIVVLLAVFISRLNFKSLPLAKQKTADSTTTQAQSTKLDSFQLKMLYALLTQAQEQIEQRHLALPKDNSALSLLAQAQKIDPQNEGLLSLKNSLKDRIIEKIKTLHSAGKQKEALAVLTNALKFYQNDKDLLKLKNYTKIQPIKIEILNGAGKKGIAKKLKIFLEQKGFQVVNTENFRINGHIRWSVLRSMMKGRFNKNDSITILNKVTGIPYQKANPYRRQNQKATLTIILGKNYSQLPPFKQ